MSTQVTSNLDFGGVARCVNHPDPVAAQDVATRAYVLASIAGTLATEAVGGTFAPYTLGASVTALLVTAASTFHGITGGAEGRELLIVNGAAFGSGINLSFVQFSSSTTGGNAEKLLLATVLGTDNVAVTCPPGSSLRLRYVSSRWRQASPIDLSALIPVGRSWGLQVDAGGNGVPVPLTGAEQGENLRVNTRQTIAGASGTIDVTLSDDTTVLVIQSTGDVSLRAMVSNATGDGRLIQIEHERTSGTGNLTVLHNTASAGFSPFFNPSTQPMIMGHATILQVRSRSGFWRPVNPGVMPFSTLGMVASEVAAGITLSAGQAQFYAKSDTPNNPYFRDDTNADRKIVTAPVALTDLATIAAGAVLGRQIDAVSGVPLALTGTELAEIIRYATVQGATLVANTNDLALNADTTVLRVGSVTGSWSLTGMTGGVAGRQVVIENAAGAGTFITLTSLDTASLTANRFRIPGGQNLVLASRDSCHALWDVTNGEWRIVSVGAPTFSQTTLNLTPSGAVGVVDISSLSSGGTVTVQPSADFSIDGFTAMQTGFCFDLVYRDTTQFVGTLSEDAGALTTSIRNPGNAATTFTTQETVRLKYAFSRWRVVGRSSRRVAVRKNNAGTTFERGRVNLIEGSGVALTVTDDAASNEVDVTIAVPQAVTITSAEVVRTGSAATIQALAVTIPANTLQVGTTLAFEVHYTHARVSATSTVQVSFGSDTPFAMLFAATGTLPAGTSSGHMRGTLICRALGSSQTVRLMLDLYDDKVGVRHTTGVYDLDTTASMLIEGRVEQTPVGPSDVLTMTQAYVLRLSKAEKI